jgi:hypothetical protein
MVYDIDLALVRLHEGGELTCTSWAGLPSLEGILRSETGYLLERGAQGVESRTPIDIQRVDEDYVTVRAREGQIRKGMSGSALVVDGVPTGLLLSVCTDDTEDPYCEPGDADILRLDAVKRYTDGFFEVQDLASGVDERNWMAGAELERRDMVAEANRMADSMMTALRGDRPTDLPNLKRDVDGLDLLPATAWKDWARYLYPNNPGASDAYLQPPSDIEDGQMRVLYASIRLSKPWLSSAPDLPETIAQCTLRESAGPVREFPIPRTGAQSSGSTIHNERAWGDTGKELAAGEYWLECMIDGQVFESNRVLLGHPLRPWGEVAFDSGGSGRIDAVVLEGPATELTWRVEGAEGQWKVKLPAPRRTNAPYVVRFEITHVSGEPPGPQELSNTYCMAQGVMTTGMNPSMPEGSGSGSGRWRLSVPMSTTGRTRPGDRSYVECGSIGGAAFFEILIEFI